MTKVTFEYIDVTVLDEELKCAICFRPFHSPVSNSKCGHTFCQECVTEWYDNSSNCPTCRENVYRNDFQPVTSRVVLNQLSRLNLKCNLCEETNIGDRQRHVLICPKQIITCTSADIQCEWKGERQELSSHLETCSFQRTRPIIDRLIQAIEILKKTHDVQNRFILELINNGSILSKNCSASKCLLITPIIEHGTFSLECSLCKNQVSSDQVVVHSCETQTGVCDTCIKQYGEYQAQLLKINLKRKCVSQQGNDGNEQCRNIRRQRSRSRSRSRSPRRLLRRSPTPS